MGQVLGLLAGLHQRAVPLVGGVEGTQTHESRDFLWPGVHHPRTRPGSGPWPTRCRQGEPSTARIVRARHRPSSARQRRATYSRPRPRARRPGRRASPRPDSACARTSAAAQLHGKQTSSAQRRAAVCSRPRRPGRGTASLSLARVARRPHGRPCATLSAENNCRRSCRVRPCPGPRSDGARRRNRPSPHVSDTVTRDGW
jgi:hypothetical protein